MSDQLLDTPSKDTLSGRRVDTWLLCLVLLIFSIEVIWLIFSEHYPLAYDESFHFGLVQFYAHHLNPIVTTQPSSTYIYGNIAHNPSFLYQYLLSFPYRLIVFFSQSLKVEVISLRLIDLALSITGLVLIKKTLVELHIKPLQATLIVFLLAFTPIYSELASNINYDNLVIPLVTLTVLLTIRLVDKLHQDVIRLRDYALLTIICLLSSLVKFEFLPIFAAVFLIVCWQLYAWARQHKYSFTKVVSVFWDQWRTVSFIVQLISFLVLLGCATLFMAYYGVGLIRYHNPVPQCNQVLSITDCSQYYAWARNYHLAQIDRFSRAMTPKSIVHFIGIWVHQMSRQLFSAPSPTGPVYFIQKSIYFLLMAAGAVGIACAAVNCRTIWQKHSRLFIATGITLIYLAALWARNYHDYKQLGGPVAIQGRYALPVLAFLYAWVILGYSIALKRYRSAQIVLAALAVCCLLFFGGFQINRTKIAPTWSWQHTSTSVSLGSYDTRANV